MEKTKYKPAKKKMTWEKFKINVDNGKYVYLMFLPIVIYFLVFSYYPMYGIIIAFKNYVPGQSYSDAQWVGLKWFVQFFTSSLFLRTLKNTLMLNVWDLCFGFTAPIIFAILMNEIRSDKIKRTVQTVSYLPHFIAIVIIVAIIQDLLSSEGMFNELIKWFYVTFKGIDPSDYKTIIFLDHPELFRPIYVFSGIWQEIGFGSILYLSALTSIDPGLYEAVDIDGGGRFTKIWNVTLPGITPTIVIMLIFAVGGIMSSGFEKVMLLYRPSTYSTSDVIATYIYRKGLQESQFSFSTAVGLFNTTINFILLITVNKIAKTVSEYSLW